MSDSKKKVATNVVMGDSKKKMVALFVAVSLSLSYFFQMLSGVAQQYEVTDNAWQNTILFTAMSKYPASIADVQKDWDRLPDWQTRVAGMMITGKITDILVDHQLKTGKAGSIGIGCWRYGYFQCAFGFYHTAWLFGVFLLLIAYRKDALIIILGTFAGVMVSTSIVGQRWYYPWDLPDMFFFTWAILLYDSRSNILPIACVIVLGGLFRESVMVAGLLIFLGEHWSFRSRLIGSIGTVLAFLMLKKLLMVACGIKVVLLSQDAFFSMHQTMRNLDLLFFHPELNYAPILSNAGALTLLFFMSNRTYRDRLFKILAAVFVCLLFPFAILTEFREWYELLPLGWIMISESYLGNGPVLSGERPGQPARPVASPHQTDPLSMMWRAIKGYFR